MEKIYKDFSNIAEIRLVYINEAHATDSNWPVGYAKELGITQHKNYGERCEVAKKLLDDKKLTIPTVIDGMDNKVNKAYKAWPDRIYLVRSDGKLAVAAKRGPWGYKPALEAAREWLTAFKETGKEPAAPKAISAKPPAKHGKASGPYVGEWEMQTEFNGGQIPATMVLSRIGGKITGVWKSQGMEMEMKDLTLKGDKISFSRSIGGEATLRFTGEFTGDKIVGKYTGDYGELACSGQRKAGG